MDVLVVRLQFPGQTEAFHLNGVADGVQMVDRLESLILYPAITRPEKCNVQYYIVEKERSADYGANGTRHGCKRLLLVIGQSDRVRIPVKLVKECLGALPTCHVLL